MSIQLGSAADPISFLAVPIFVERGVWETFVIIRGLIEKSQRPMYTGNLLHMTFLPYRTACPGNGTPPTEPRNRLLCVNWFNSIGDNQVGSVNPFWVRAVCERSR